MKTYELDYKDLEKQYRLGVFTDTHMFIIGHNNKINETFKVGHN